MFFSYLNFVSLSPRWRLPAVPAPALPAPARLASARRGRSRQVAAGRSGSWASWC